MENKYQLTQEEINKILRRSPYSLGHSPAESGLGAEQIKRYFYDFIYYMAQMLNLRLGALGQDMALLSDGIDALHSELLAQLASSIDAHSSNGESHLDIREMADGAMNLARNAYNLASGKSKVYINTSFRYAIMELQNEALNMGDFIMVIDKNCPDFVVLSLVNSGVDAVEIDVNDVYSGNLPQPQVGEIYRLKDTGVEILAIESGIDTSAFARSEQVGEIDRALELILEIQSSLIGGDGE